MKGLLFPGQGAQFTGMGKELYETNDKARETFEKANEVLGFRITDVMFEGSEDELKRTDITQPALFIHSMAALDSMEQGEDINGVAGHSLGEFSALVACECLEFEDALQLVRVRANAMQKACEMNPGTMAAIVGLEDEAVERICQDIDATVVTANYNCPGQLVISGSIEGINKAVDVCQEEGAKRAIVLGVGGAFHSPLMQPAKEELEQKINATKFKSPICPIYQNVTAVGETSEEAIRQNLILQLTSPVRWTLSMQNMIKDGFDAFTEVGGNGAVLRGLMRRIDRSKNVDVIK